MIDRAPGEGRYARLEREQRWVLRQLPSDVVGPPVSVTDVYLTGTTLRLRRMEAGASVVHKLGQKVRTEPGSPTPVMLTNIYLSAVEYGMLITLGGHKLRKTRWRWPQGGRIFAVDRFEGRLGGLVLAEIELEGGESRHDRPPLAVAEVTEDDRFSGGSLSRTTHEQLRRVLEELSGPSPP
jgi:CYTH domain-containing protein